MQPFSRKRSPQSRNLVIVSVITFAPGWPTGLLFCKALQAPCWGFFAGKEQVTVDRGGMLLILWEGGSMFPKTWIVSPLLGSHWSHDRWVVGSVLRRGGEFVVDELQKSFYFYNTRKDSSEARPSAKISMGVIDFYYIFEVISRTETDFKNIEKYKKNCILNLCKSPKKLFEWNYAAK